MIADVEGSREGRAVGFDVVGCMFVLLESMSERGNWRAVSENHAAPVEPLTTCRRRDVHHPAAVLNAIRTFALALPGTQPKSPWPGHDDVAVNDKTFLYLGVHEDKLSVGVKLRVSGAAVRRLPNAKPMAYGLGKSGWVSIAFDPRRHRRSKRSSAGSWKATAPRRPSGY